jgi:hypothetical protein
MAKSQFPAQLNWQTTSPATGFLPQPGPNSDVPGNSYPSGTAAGTMSSTNTIYTNILGISVMDNVGIELTWTGTPTGTFQVMVSNSGINFYALSGFNPSLTQPSGSAGGTYIQLSPIAARYMFIQYTNSSGTGTVTAYTESKANNR